MFLSKVTVRLSFHKTDDRFKAFNSAQATISGIELYHIPEMVSIKRQFENTFPAILSIGGLVAPSGSQFTINFNLLKNLRRNLIFSINEKIV